MHLDILSDIDGLSSDDHNVGILLGEGDDEKEEEEDSGIKLSYCISNTSDDSDASLNGDLRNTILGIDIDSLSDDLESGAHLSSSQLY
jgi:hypothetical protein